MSTTPYDPNYGLGSEPTGNETDLDQMTREQLEKVADLMVDRIELAVVQRIPQRLLDAMYEGGQSWTLPGVSGPNYVALEVNWRGNVLEVRFIMNAQVLATFRFAGDHILGSGGT
jgi:hypothetical protein